MGAIGLAIVGLIVAVGYGGLLWQASGRERAPFALAAMPLALLLFIAPMPLSAWDAIQAFQAIAETGQGQGTGPALALGIARPLRTGLVLFLIALVIAAILQLRLEERAVPDARTVLQTIDEPTPTAAPAANPPWTSVLLVLPAVLIVPAGILLSLAAVPRLLVQVGLVLSQPDPPSTVGGMELSELSTWFSTRLLTVLFGGGFLMAVGAALSAAAFAAFAYSTSSRRLTRLSWILLPLFTAVGGWFVVRLSLDIHGFAQHVTR